MISSLCRYAPWPRSHPLKGQRAFKLYKSVSVIESQPQSAMEAVKINFPICFEKLLSNIRPTVHFQNNLTRLFLLPRIASHPNPKEKSVLFSLPRPLFTTRGLVFFHISILYLCLNATISHLKKREKKCIGRYGPTYEKAVLVLKYSASTYTRSVDLKKNRFHCWMHFLTGNRFSARTYTFHH